MKIKFKKIFNIKIFLFLVIFIFANLYTTNKDTEVITSYDNKDINVQTSYDLEMPPFGKFKITGIVDILNGEFTLKGSPQKELFNLGLLKIENPFIEVTNKKGLIAQANVIIFNKKATVGILEFIPRKRIIYNITPANAIEIPITPWQSTTIKEFTLLITPEVFELSAIVQIFGKSNIIKFGKTRLSKKSSSKKLSPETKREGKGKIEEKKSSLEIENDEKKGIPDNYAELIVENIKPSDIIKNMAGTQFDNIIFEYARFRIDNPFSKKTEHHITIEAITNLEKLSLPLNVNLSRVEAIIEINKTTGLILETFIPKIKIMNNSTLSDLSLQIILPPKIVPQSTQTTKPIRRKRVEKPSIFLSGTANLELPFVGKINNEFDSTYHQGIFNFETKTNKNINFENIFDLKNVTLKYSSSGKIEIIGDTKIFDLELIGHLKLSKTLPQKSSSSTSPVSERNTTQQTTARSNQTNEQEISKKQIQPAKKSTPKNIKVGDYYVEFSATAKNNKTIKPFANIPEVQNIKQIADISISNLGIGMKADKTLYITGQTEILKFKSNVQLEMKSKSELTLKTRPPKNWKLSDSIKSLNRTLFDDMDLSDTQIIISTFSHFDPNLNLTLKKGINFIAGAQLTGETFNSAKALVRALDDNLRISGSIGNSPSDIYFSMQVPTKKVKLSDKATLKNISFFLSGEGPSMGLKAQIIISPDKQDKPLVFTGKVFIDPTKLGGTLSATMQGKWEHPLGIKGLTLQDVAIEGTLPALTNAGFTGIMIIGDNKMIKVATKYSIDGDIVFLGEYNGKLLLEDLIGIALKVALESNAKLNIEQFKDKFPDIGFENTMFKFAPRSTNIGEIHFDPGISLKGTFFVLNKEGKININVGSKGIIAQGTMYKFNIGPIEISGAGLDGIYGNEDDGVVIDFILSPEEQHLILSGLIDLKIAKGQGDVHIGRDKINIFLSATLFKKLEANLALYSVGSIKRPDELDFIYIAVVNNKMNDYFSEQITKGFNSFFKKILKATRDKIKKKELKIEKIQQNINEKQLTLKKLNYDKENGRFTKLALNKNMGIRYYDSSLDLAAHPKKRQFDIFRKITKTSGEIEKLEIEKMKIETERKTALAKLEIPNLYASNWFTKTIQKATKSIGESAKRTGETISDTTKKTTKAIGEIAEKAGKTVGRSAEDIGESVRRTMKSLDETAKNVREAAKKATTTLDDSAKQLTTGLKNKLKKKLEKGIQLHSLIKIKKIEISGSAKETIKGHLAKLHIDFEILGKPKEVNLQVDMMINPKAIFKTLGENIARVINS